MREIEAFELKIKSIDSGDTNIVLCKFLVDKWGKRTKLSFCHKMLKKEKERLTLER